MAALDDLENDSTDADLDPVGILTKEGLRN
jgi:hypothetical protein